MTKEIAGIDSLFRDAEQQNELLHDHRKHQLRKFYIDRAMRSHLLLSAGMGAVAAALPVLLMIFADQSHGSISHYYYDSGPAARNILVGSLGATGMFLILFRGLSSVENHFLRLAGIFAILVAMFPTPEPPIEGLSIHIVSAVLFFVCLAIVAIFYSKLRICDIRSRAKKRFFLRAYNAAGAAMVGMPALVLAMHLMGGSEDWIFWVETFGIWAFAAYWAVKTYEYRLLLGVRWRAVYLDDGAEAPRSRVRSEA